MGKLKEPDNVMLTVTVMSRHTDILEKAQNLLASKFGNICFESQILPFSFTDYYKADMGENLQFRIFCFENLIEPDKLVEFKHQTNEIENEFAVAKSYAENLPINLDPGYISLHKFVLASTKDTSYRVYLHDGIYAEITLTFADGKWNSFKWSYPSYNLPDIKVFLKDARVKYLNLRNLTI